jgi:uncharacterized protein YciI
MPHFAVIARDGPDGPRKRAEARDAHFAHIEAIMDKVAIAGPIKDASGGFVGSVVIIDVADAEEARAVLESDPYFKAGVWAETEIHPFLAAAGTWIGGKSW